MATVEAVTADGLFTVLAVLRFTVLIAPFLMTGSCVRSFTHKGRNTLVRKATGIVQVSVHLPHRMYAFGFNWWWITVNAVTKLLSEVFQGPRGHLYPSF